MDPRNARRTATRILIAAGLLPHLPDALPLAQTGPTGALPVPPGPIAPVATSPDVPFPGPRLDQAA